RPVVEQVFVDDLGPGPQFDGLAIDAHGDIVEPALESLAVVDVGGDPLASVPDVVADDNRVAFLEVARFDLLTHARQQSEYLVEGKAPFGVADCHDGLVALLDRNNVPPELLRLECRSGPGDDVFLLHAALGTGRLLVAYDNARGEI